MNHVRNKAKAYVAAAALALAPIVEDAITEAADGLAAWALGALAVAVGWVGVWGVPNAGQPTA